ncbi:paraneoplastic antigen Ma3-like [Amphiura filiformis]|uniref:paraneoplastic antigen Ma3-like n=1 Tax=Amphiura filiformis TaxID=82378 RepID=UPI003B2117B6
MTITGGTKWDILRLKDQPADEAFLTLHNKSLEDLQENIPGAVHNHVYTIGKHLTKPQYRHLRMFSGKSPVPSGKLPFETWVQHADQVAQDSSLSDEEKRSRLVDGLTPPALTVYRKAMLASRSSLTAPELIIQLRKAFGVACETGELYLVFRETYQKSGETPSAYLTRLEEALDRAIAFGEVSDSEADSLRLSQLIKGCIYSEGLVGTLQLRQGKGNPLSLVALLQEVCIEEAAELSRLEKRQLDKPALSQSDGMARELRELKAQVAALQSPGPSSATRGEQSPASKQGDTADLVDEVRRLKKALEDVQRGNPGRQYSHRPRSATFCYKCRQQGHMQAGCDATPNPELVQQKLLAQAQRSGNGEGRLQEGRRVPKQH